MELLMFIIAFVLLFMACFGLFLGGIAAMRLARIAGGKARGER